MVGCKRAARTAPVAARAFFCLVLSLLFATPGCAKTGEEAVAEASASASASAPARIESECGGDFGAEKTAAGNVLIRSPWLDRQRELYAAIISERKSWQTVVAPVGTAGYGFDQAERVLLAAQITHALAARGAVGVSDPLLMAKLGGQHVRVPDADAVRRAVRKKGTTVIYWPTVCHNRLGRMRLLLTREILVDGQSTESSRFGPFTTDYSGTRLPGDALAALLAGGVDVPGLSGRSPAPVAKAGGVTRFELPDALLLPQDQPVSPLTAAYRLQLIGALMPRHLDSARVDAHLAALLAAQGAGNSAEARLLRARALFYLGRREAAIAELADTAIPEASVLRALLDGNAVDARRLVDSITSPLPRLLAEIDLLDLHDDYDLLSVGERRGRVMRVVGNPAWRPLLERRMSLNEPWETQDNDELLALLENNGGVFVAVAERAPSIAGQVDSFLYTGRDADAARESAKRQVGELLDAFMLTNRLHAVRFFHYIQQRTEIGRELLDAMRVQYAGQPDFELLDARVAYDELNDTGQGGDEYLAKVADVSLLLQSTRMWAMTQPQESANKLSTWFALWDAYAYDYPSRQDYCPSPYSTAGEAIEWQFRDVVANTIQSYACAGQYRYYLSNTRNDAQAAEGVYRASQLRNKEVPARFQDDVEQHWQSEAYQAAATVYERWIDTGTASSSPYIQMARLAFYLGDSDRAWATIQRYPGFAPGSGELPVTLTNVASTVAAWFYRAGEFDRSMALDRRAAGYRTRSSLDYEANSRLNFLAGDISGAARTQAAAYKHYGYMDNLALMLASLHVLGEGAHAWKIFESELGKMQGHRLLMSADCGLRVEGRSNDEAMAWFHQESLKRLGKEGFQTAAVAAAAFFTTDRALPENFSSAIYTLEGLPEQTVFAGGMMSGGVQSGMPFAYLDKPAQVPDRERSQTIPSELVRYAETHAQLARQDFRRACDVTRRVRYPFGISPDRYLTPYFAYACVRAGDASFVSAYLEEGVRRGVIKEPAFDYNYQLSQAFLLAGAGKIGDARKAIRRAAMLDYPSTSPQPRKFQILQSYEWLQAISGSQQFRNDALAYARASRRGRPTDSYSHAYVARWTTDGRERAEALAYAMYLDPNSEMVLSMSDADRAAATAEIRKERPFSRKAVGQGQ